MDFDFDGERYRLASSHQQEWAERILEEFSFHGDEEILDLGCGDGRITERLAEQVPRGRVLGIDSSRSMIAAAQRHRRRGNVDFVLQDINELDAVARFDCIFSNAALHWVGDHGKLLANVYRALKPGGSIRFNFAAEGNCSFFFKVIRQAMAESRFISSFQDFTWPWFMPSGKEYGELVAASDFYDSEIWQENADRYFADREAMIRWIDQPSIVPFLQVVPREQRRSFRNHVVKAMIAATERQDGRCFETFRRINLRARR